MRVSQLWTVTFFKPHINVTMCALFCTFLSNTTFFKQFSHHFRRFLNYFCNSYITRNDSHIVNCCWTIYLSDIDTVSDGNFPYSLIINYSCKNKWRSRACPFKYFAPFTFGMEHTVCYIPIGDIISLIFQ